MPNFFLVAKKPNRIAKVAGQQVCHNSGLSVWGFYSLRSYKNNKSEYNNNAYTIMSTYNIG